MPAGSLDGVDFSFVDPLFQSRIAHAKYFAGLADRIHFGSNCGPHRAPHIEDGRPATLAAIRRLRISCSGNAVTGAVTIQYDSARRPQTGPETKVDKFPRIKSSQACLKRIAGNPILANCTIVARYYETN